MSPDYSDSELMAFNEHDAAMTPEAEAAHGDHPLDSYLYDGCPGCAVIRNTPQAEAAHRDSPLARSLVCSIHEHAKCDGNAPNGPAGIGSPCCCDCHVAPTASRDGEVAAALDVERLARTLVEDEDRDEVGPWDRKKAERLAAIYARLAAPSAPSSGDLDR